MPTRGDHVGLRVTSKGLPSSAAPSGMVKPAPFTVRWVTVAMLGTSSSHIERKNGGVQVADGIGAGVDLEVDVHIHGQAVNVQRHRHHIPGEGRQRHGQAYPISGAGVSAIWRRCSMMFTGGSVGSASRRHDIRPLRFAVASPEPR